jgi:hypothetical protein
MERQKGMTDRKDENNASLLQRETLLSIRREILSLSPEKALERIFGAKHPAALIHSFSETDFYFLVNDIGILDSLEIFALASDRQWEYLLDISLWEKDRIDISSATMWLDLLFQAAPVRFIKWVVEKKTEFIEYYLYKNIKVVFRDHDEDPSFIGKDFVTYDDVYYIKVSDDYYDHDEMESGEDEEGLKEKREEFIKKMLAKIAEYDYGKFRDILFETMTILPAEAEEEFYRQRNVRLEEKGFMPFYEAAGVYASLKPGKLPERKKRAGYRDENGAMMPVPLYPFRMLKDDNLFTRSLQRIEPGEVLNELQAEFAALCNRIISADLKMIRSKDELGEVVKKACGYLSIGIERLAHDGQKSDIARSAALMGRYHLEHIFRTGFGLALELKERADKWMERSWFRGRELPLLFWGEKWTGVLGGLLIRKPLYFDNYKTGNLYREFLSLSELAESGKILDEIISFDGLFSVIDPDIKKIKGGSLNFKKLVLTLFARHRLGLQKEASPVPYDDFVRFFNGLWAGKGKSRKIDISVKASFLEWIKAATGLAFPEITDKLGRVFDGLFNELESEYKKVARNDLDTRFINLFIVEKKQ